MKRVSHREEKELEIPPKITNNFKVILLILSLGQIAQLSTMYNDIITNSINSLLISSRSIPNGEHTKHC